jgi:hypothetical protein
MALAKNIMSGGFSAGQAKSINGAIATGISAAGTVITDATDLVADVNAIGTCASGAGVQLANCEVGDSQIVYNGGANACKVYPDTSSSQINQITAGSAHSLATSTACTYYKISTTRWVAVLSA